MRKKTVVIALAITLGVILLLFFSIKKGESWDIYYDGISMSPADKNDFMQRFRGQVAAQGYKEINYNPKWSLISFAGSRQKIICYVNENDSNGKSIFFWLEHDDNIRIIFKYYVEGNPYLLTRRITNFRNFAYKLTKILPELKIDSDDYLKYSGVPEKVIRKANPERVLPVHTNLEIYLNRYTISPEQGAISRPYPSIWAPNAGVGYSFGVGEIGEPQYSASIEYKGTKNGSDYYSITIIYPAKNHIASFTKEIIYKGDDIEIWRDSEYRAGVRPRTDKNDSK